MQKSIVSDTSCLITLQKINQLHLLKQLFGTVFITKEVENEFNDNLPGFFEIRNVRDANYHKILSSFLDKGEASVIALALELDDCLLVIDESKGRKEAKLLGIKITGTLGLLLLAKEKKLISKLRPLIDQINYTNFRISKALIDKTLKMAGE